MALVGAVAIAPTAMGSIRSGLDSHREIKVQQVSAKTNSPHVVALFASSKNDDKGKNVKTSDNKRNDDRGNNDGDGGGDQGRGDEGRGDDGRGRGHEHDHDGCHYPPTRTPYVSLTVTRYGPDHVHLTGTATANGCKQTGHSIGLYYARNGRGDWRLVTSATTDKAGQGAFTVAKRPGGLYRIAVAGDDSYLPAVSDPVRVR